MTGKIAKSLPHFQAKQRVSPHFLAGGGIASFGLRFHNVAYGEPVHMSGCVNARVYAEGQVRFCWPITEPQNSHRQGEKSEELLLSGPPCAITHL